MEYLALPSSSCHLVNFACFVIFFIPLSCGVFYLFFQVSLFFALIFRFTADSFDDGSVLMKITMIEDIFHFLILPNC